MQGNVHSASAPTRWRARATRAELGAHQRACCRRPWQGDPRKQEFAPRRAMLVREELSHPHSAPQLAVRLSPAARLWAPVLHAWTWLAAMLCMRIFMSAACRSFLAIPQGATPIGAPLTSPWADPF